MAQIIDFPGLTTVPEPPNQVLEKAKQWGLAECLIIGTNEDGRLLFGGSHCEVAGLNLLLDRAKTVLLVGPEQD